MAKVFFVTIDEDGNKMRFDAGKDIPLVDADKLYTIGCNITLPSDDGVDREAKIVEVRLDCSKDQVDLVLELPRKLRIRTVGP